MSAAHPGREPADRRPGTVRVVGVAAAVHATSMLPMFLTGAMGVQLQADLDFGPTALGIASGSFVLARALTSISMGKLADRLGAIRSMRLSAIGCGLAATSAALLVRGWAGLVVTLVFAGVVQAISQPAANRFVARGVPAERMGIAFGFKQSGPPIAIGLAGIAVPVLALTVGWRWAYGMAAVFALLTLVSIPPRPSTRRQAEEHVAATQPAATDGAQPEGRPAGGTGGLGLVMVGNALALGVINAMHTFVVGAGAAAGIGLGLAGLLLTVGSVVAIATRIWSGAAADRRGSGHLEWVARMLLIGSAGYLLLATGRPVLYVIGVVLAYGGTWGMTGLMFFAIVRHSPGSPAAATGKIIAAGSLGGFLGPPLFGLVVQSVGYGPAWIGTAACTVAAAVAIRSSAAARAEKLAVDTSAAGRRDG